MGQQEFPLFETRPVCSVTEIVEQLRADVESRFRNVWVQGEISNLARPASGHLYFTLKDDRSQLAAVCFRLQNRYLRFDPEDGMDVVARGSAAIYAPRGQLQLIVETLEPVGRGALQVAFEQLRERLAGEGLFDTARKKALPLVPHKVGVVTSPSGAAFRDILQVLDRRNRAVHVLLYPARVQGTTAAAEIEAGLRALGNRHDVDVVIVARGGGSLEDLWAFNEERVARAIFECPLPVISAVGHEVDFTIADFVADLRAPTPSAAAEMVSGQREELLQRVAGLRQRAIQAAQLAIREGQHRLHRLLSRPGFVDTASRLRLLSQRLDELDLRLGRRLPSLISDLKTRTDLVRLQLVHACRASLSDRKRSLERAGDRLEAISPLNVLQRGYALVSSADGALVRRPDQLAAGELFEVQVAEGRFQARKEDEDV